PVAAISSPDNGEKVWERQFPLAVRGSVLAPGGAVRTWQLSVREVGHTRRHEIACGTESVTDDALGTLPLGRPYRVYPRRQYLLELEVEDTLGNTAVDTKTFLVPGPRFATIPVPDPLDEGGQNLGLSDDGTRLAL